MSGVELIRKWFEQVWNAGRDEAIYELLVPDSVFHTLGPGGMRGPDAFQAFARRIHSAFSDLHFDVTHAIESGDLVAVRCEVTATHRASGRKVHFDGGGFARVRDNHLVEGWDSWDFQGLAQQLGDPPSPAMAILFG